MLISIVVATYNRSNLIKNQINAINSMNSGNIGQFEVIYVDNGSDDGTLERLSELTKNLDNFRVVQEAQQGLSFVRNRGAAEARGEYIWYMDDDSLPHKNSLAAYSRALREWMPEIATGPIIARTHGKMPWWLDINDDYFDAYLARYNYGSKTKLLNTSAAWGPNLLISKAAMDRVGGFNPALGVRGRYRGSGEEEELQDRIRADGGRLLYVGDATVDHVMPIEKKRLSYFLRQRAHRAENRARTSSNTGQVARPFFVLVVKFSARAARSCFYLGVGRPDKVIRNIGKCADYYGVMRSKLS